MMNKTQEHFLTAAFLSALMALVTCGGDTSAAAEPGKVTMTTGQGKTMTLTMQTLKESRGYLYCELVFDYGEHGNDIYSTSPLAEANLEWWNGLDLEALANEFGAKSVYKNGPQWWSMDEVALMLSEPVKVAGVKMVFGGHLPPGTLKIPKYTVFSPAKFQNLLWKAGKPVYQLIDPDGHVYVLQGHKLPAAELATLGEKFKKLPDGWEYRAKVLDEDLVMKLTPNRPIPSVQDEFDQIYIRIPTKGNAIDKAQSVKKVTVDNTRDMRFGEILVVRKDFAEVYNSTGLNECPAELWDAIDTEKLAREFVALRVQKNGPKYWVMDSQTIMLGEKASFGRLGARWAASLPVALLGKEGAAPYEVFMPKKTQRMVYDKGRPVFELVDPDGHAYVLQAHGPAFTLESLPKLGERMKKLPKGWRFRTRTLTKDLVLDLTPDKTIYAVGDEFHQYYTRIPEAE